MGRLARTDASPLKANNVRRTASDAGQATSPRNLSRLPTSVRSGAVLRRARGTVDSLPLPRSRTKLRNRSARGPEPAVRLPASSRPRGYGCVRLLHLPPPLRGPVAEVLLEVGRTRAGSSRLTRNINRPRRLTIRRRGRVAPDQRRMMTSLSSSASAGSGNAHITLYTLRLGPIRESRRARENPRRA